MKMVKMLRRFLGHTLAHSDKGFAMAEVLVALALMGITGVCFLAALTSVSRSTISADRHSTADSLAASQMEYVLSQTYNDAANPPQYALLPDMPNGWSVNLIAARLDPENNGVNDDNGIHEIGISVNFGNRQIVTLTSRKVKISYVT